MYRRLLIALVIMLIGKASTGQAELQKIMPLSPNAAAIAKYGETPVGYFTGVPSISVPLYGIKGKELQLPLNLSYHAGGNKVEDIASWVGLGWSLGTIPSISRTVRGIPDEDGYFSLYSGKTVNEIYDERFGGGGVTTYANFLGDVRTGSADSEPDIFFYSLANKSGKFYYSQTTQQFHTIPYENIKIERITNGFRIISDDGTRYDFNVPEFSYQGLTQSLNSWWASKMVNANRTDSITFDYTTVVESFISNASVTKNIYLSGNAGCDYPQYELNQPGTETYTVKPDQINFSSGYVKFIQQSSTRTDLSGGKALDRVEIYNYRDELIKKYKFRYEYYNSRLILDTLREIGITGDSLSPYIFSYRTDISLSSPNGQDYWGFYNGVSTNTDLIPEILYQFPSTSYKSKIPGADRTVHPAFTQFSILNKITYPTGGTTEFEYENNEVSDTTFPVQTKDTSLVLSGNGGSYSTTEHFEKNFRIDVPADAFINNNQGGAFIDVVVGSLGCDLCGGANLCANLFITDASNNPVSSSFTENIKGYYLPNGNYKLVADFNQDPVAFQNFFFGLLWKNPDSAFTGRHFVGGARIKKISDYDGIDHGRDVIRSFSYGNDTSENVSSGNVFGLSYFNFIENFNFSKYSNGGGGCDFCTVNLLKRVSYSTITAVSHSGSFVGYKKVNVGYGSSAQNGRSTYRFSNEIDIGATSFPYPPSISREQRRGLLLESVDFKKSGSDFIPVNRVRNTYYPYTYYVVPGVNNSLEHSLKIACNDIVVDVCNGIPQKAEQIVHLYDIQSDWMQLFRTEEKLYSQDDTTKFVVNTTDYTYDTTHLQLVRSKTWTSTGDSLQTVSSYPYQLSLSGSAETARLALITQNRISSVLKSEKYKNTTLNEEIKNNYKQFPNGVIMPEEIFQKIGSGSSESRIKFLRFTPQGSLLEQQKTNDVISTYLWDYNNNYPVAEVVNADSASVAATSFEAEGKGGWSFTGATSMHPSAPTGKKGYSLVGGDITRSGLSNGTTYVVTYWKRDTTSTVTVNTLTGTALVTKNGWKLFRHVITGTASLTIAGTAYIDELRLHPKDALMKTYTYIPLVGVTSECDANNKTIYYEYDGFQRLKLIKDEDGNILKRLEYKYDATNQQ